VHLAGELLSEARGLVKISHPDLKARAAPAQQRDLDRARTRGSVRSPQEVTSAGTVNAFAPPSSEHS
jgi:hypothetical protein